jgi:hypothetical protein
MDDDDLPIQYCRWTSAMQGVNPNAWNNGNTIMGLYYSRAPRKFYPVPGTRSDRGPMPGRMGRGDDPPRSGEGDGRRAQAPHSTCVAWMRHAIYREGDAFCGRCCFATTT